MKSLKKTCIFVCSEKDGCGGCGSRKLVRELKKIIKRSEDDLSGKYKVIESGCLGYCSKGIVAVAFPENRLFTKLDKRDASYVLAELDENRRARQSLLTRGDGVPLSSQETPLSH